MVMHSGIEDERSDSWPTLSLYIAFVYKQRVRMILNVFNPYIRFDITEVLRCFLTFSLHSTGTVNSWTMTLMIIGITSLNDLNI